LGGAASGGAASGGSGAGSGGSGTASGGRSDVARANDGRVPVGHLLVVLGHRPPDIGGYDPNPIADRIRSQLVEQLSARAAIQPDLVVVSGLRLGVEMLAAEAASEAGVEWVAVLPHPDPDKVWPAERRAHFADLLDQARDVITLERRRPSDRAAAGASLARRDGWLAKSVDEALIIFDGVDKAVGSVVDRFDRAVGDGLTIMGMPTA